MIPNITHIQQIKTKTPVTPPQKKKEKNIPTTPIDKKDILHKNYGYYVNKNFEIKTKATNNLIESDDPIPSSNR
tara:strand:- start:2084 stop:2305 length:222 start_codon:yes stop_codon:yes gene_type:complete